jgi:hypothetical protein
LRARGDRAPQSRKSVLVHTFRSRYPWHHQRGDRVPRTLLPKWKCSPLVCSPGRAWPALDALRDADVAVSPVLECLVHDRIIIPGPRREGCPLLERVSLEHGLGLSCPYAGPDCALLWWSPLNPERAPALTAFDPLCEELSRGRITARYSLAGVL